MRRAIWLWDAETAAEALGEAELSSPDTAQGLDGKALLMQEGDLSGEDREKVNEMLRRVAFMWMQDLVVLNE